MSQSIFHLILLIAGTFQYAKCDSPVMDTFSHNWTYSGEDVALLYDRQWFFQRELTFVAHDTSKDYCEVSNVYTDTSAYDLRTCNYEFTSAGGDKVTIEGIRNYQANGEGISLTWFTQKMKNQGMSRFASINMKHCSDRRDALEKLESEAPAAPQNTSVPNFPTEEIKYENVSEVLNHMNFSWVGGVEGPVEINSSKGLFFLGQRDASDPKVNAMFMDLTTKEIQVLGDIDSSVTKGESRTSRAHKKYGECWMDTTNKMICSQQQLLNGYPQMMIFQQTVNFPDSIDWFSMTNLREPAILIVTGKCSGGSCNSYTVRKLSSGENKVLFDIGKLNVKCESASGLTIDITDYGRNGVFCFHLVCNHKYTGKESGAELQYRRHCVKRDVITTWS